MTLDKCVECNEEVKAGDKAMECDICKNWTHIKCGKVSASMYGELKKAASGMTCQGIKFLCAKCEKVFVTMKADIIKMLEKQEVMEKKQEGLSMGLGAVRKEVDELKALIKKANEQKVMEDDPEKVKVVEEIGDIKIQIGELKKKYSDATRVEGAEGIIVRSSHQISDTKIIQGEVSEMMERDKRKNNLVIFGIMETDDESVTRGKVNEIITVTGMDVNKVKYFGRVGRRTQDGKHRVVRVVCDDMETKRAVLKGANKLRMTTGYERTYISPDLTKCQQEMDKKLRDALREIRKDHKEAKISNGEIIIMNGGEREILFPVVQN